MRFLLLLLLAFVAVAQNAFWLDLSGPWLANDGSREFEVQLPLRTPNDSIRSLKRNFPLESQVRDPLSLTIGAIAESYELFVNGALVGSVGAIGHESLAQPRVFDLPAGLVTQKLEIEIRLRKQSLNRVTGAWLITDEGPWLLTTSIAAPRNSAELTIARRKLFRIADLTQPMILLSLAFVIGLIWIRNFDRTVLGWTFALLICLAVGRLWIYSMIQRDSEPFQFRFLVELIRHQIPVALLAHVVCLTVGAPRWILIPAWILPVLGILLPDWTAGAAVTLIARLFVLIGIWIGYQRQSPKRYWLVAGLGFTVYLQGSTDFLRVGLPAFDEAFLFGYRFNPFVMLVTILSASIAFSLVRELLHDRDDKMRLEADLEAARTVQTLLLPQTNLIGGVETVYAPAQVVGGDFYLVEPLPDGSNLIAVGDVSGKGLKAAMVVSMVVGAFRSRQSNSPAALLKQLNSVLHGKLDGGFVTCVVARIETSGSATLANAGHPSAYLGGAELPAEQGLPLGIVGDADYEETGFTLEAGDQLTLVSDGVVEAENTERELFGFERTREISMKTAQEIAEAAKAWGQNDDITVVTVQRRSQ